MMKNKLLLLLALLMTAATGAWAQEQWDVVWDFTAWSTETVTALKADAAASNLEGWSDIEKKADAEAGANPDAAAKDNCFWFAGTVNEDGSLSANGAVIKELKGLKFDSDYAAQRKLAIAVNYPSTNLGDYAGGAYLWLGGGGSKQTYPCFTIPGVKAGSKITVELESHKPSSARGIGLYKNSYAAENLIGEQFKPTAKEAKTWDITEDCDVVVWNTSNCHIYTIKVKAPAAAPAGYTVSLKDGVKDADKWTVSPNPAEEGQTVTLQYTGRLKVKGVKATSEAAAPSVPDGALSGVFSVSDTKQVYFSKGNLQATYNGSNWSWAFAEHQWDYIGNAAGNTKVTESSPYISENATVDLFGWVGAACAWTGAAQYGISNVKQAAQYGYVEGEALKSDWGTLAITNGGNTANFGWRTLTGGDDSGEWEYLFQTRTTPSGVRYAHATVNSVPGLVLLPDDWSTDYYSLNKVNDANGTAYTDNVISSSDWTSKLEAHGAVFLPAGGNRNAAEVSDAGVGGIYWSSTSSTTVSAIGFRFSSAKFGGSTQGFTRNRGCSVRLVCEVATSEAAQSAKPAATVTTAPTGAAIVGRLNTNSTALVSGGVAEGGKLMYAVTTTNTMPTSTAGFSDAVPTAQDITASGTVYVWYYVKADDTHSDSEIAATAIEVPVADIVWDRTNVSDLGVFEGDPYEKEGVTLRSNGENVFAWWDDFGDPTRDGIEFEAEQSGGYTFTAPTGKAFTKIEMTLTEPWGWDSANLGDGWTYNNSTVTWKGTAAASTVELLTDDIFYGATVKSIVFYLSE